MRILRSAGVALFVALFVALALFTTGAFAQSAQVSKISEGVTAHSAVIVRTRMARPFGFSRARSFTGFRVRAFRTTGAYSFNRFRVRTARFANLGLRARAFGVVGINRHFGHFRRFRRAFAQVGVVGINRHFGFFRHFRRNVARVAVVRARASTREQEDCDTGIEVNAFSFAGGFGGCGCDCGCGFNDGVFGWW